MKKLVHKLFLDFPQRFIDSPQEECRAREFGAKPNCILKLPETSEILLSSKKLKMIDNFTKRLAARERFFIRKFLNAAQAQIPGP